MNHLGHVNVILHNTIEKKKMDGMFVSTVFHILDALVKSYIQQ